MNKLEQIINHFLSEISRKPAEQLQILPNREVIVTNETLDDVEAYQVFQAISKLNFIDLKLVNSSGHVDIEATNKYLMSGSTEGFTDYCLAAFYNSNILAGF